MLTVLSPHIDDAAYALAMALRRVASKGETIDLVNCFTQSDHAPQETVRANLDISALRAQEDAAFIKHLRGRVSAHYLGLADTSARAGDDTLADAFHRREFAVHERKIMSELHAAFLEFGIGANTAHVLLVPMAYGNHVDHRLVRTVAEELVSGDRIIYYEDMPYSYKAPRRSIRKHLARDGFEPLIITGDDEALSQKDRAIQLYASQLEPSYRQWILERGRQLGGERVWLSERALEALWS